MKKEKRIPFVLPVLCIVPGILAFITADRALQVICYTASGVLILIGIACVIRYLIGTPEENFASNGFHYYIFFSGWRGRGRSLSPQRHNFFRRSFFL